MADDLILQPDGICGGTAWWNNYPAGGARSCLFSGGGGGGMSSALLPSYCSVGGGGDGGYGWLMSSSTDDLGIKGNLMTPSNFYDDQQQQHLESSSNFYDDIKVQESYNKTGYGQPADQTVDGVGGDGGGGLMDASATTLHEMIGFELSPSSSTSVDWNQQSLFSSGATADESYNSIILQENQANITRLNNYEDSNFIQKEWKSLDSPPSTDQQQRHHQQAMNSGNCSTSSGDSSTVTYEAAATGGGNRPPLVPTTATTPTFPMNSYSSPSSSSPLIQNMLVDQVLGDLRPQASLFSNDYSPAGGIMNNNNNNNYVGNFQTNGLVNGGPGHNLLSTSTAAALEDIRATLLGTTAHNYIPHHQPPTSNPNLASKVRKDGHEPRHSVPAAGSSKGRNNNEQPAFKRPRIDTPSPLPTFKVRKEKLGDRITALQQLVSPFGKTDTASVLQEAIEYIKFLHEQVHVLTTPYLKTNGVAQHPYPQQQQTVNSNKQGAKEREVGSSKQDLRSRGLCLVPLSTTFPVASETPVDFWTPTFGSTFR